MNKIKDWFTISITGLVALLTLLVILFAIDAVIACILVWLYNILAVNFGWITLSFWQMFIICVIIHLISRFLS